MEFCRPPAVECGIDRGFALFRDFGLLADDDAEGGSWQHGCLVFE